MISRSTLLPGRRQYETMAGPILDAGSHGGMERGEWCPISTHATLVKRCLTAGRDLSRESARICLEAPTSHVGHMPAGWVPRPPSEDRVAGPYESTAGYRLIS